jgi:adsorption protein B
MEAGAPVVAAMLPWLLGWLAVSGIDDMVLLGVFALACPRAKPPPEQAVAGARRKHIAVFVPCWREEAVIGRMLRHNLGACRYREVVFFVGVYPNDPATAAAVSEVAAEDSRVHAAVCPRPGPTSKADCLNALFTRMGEYEQEAGIRFGLVVVHDAEDVIHADELAWLNFYGESYAMIQIPVLALPTPWHYWTHGIYCDDFAQFHTIELPARVRMGGFLPSAGVGTAYHREALDRMAAQGNTLFDPSNLTEDYENGYRLYRMGARQLFLPICMVDGAPMATREFFPLGFWAALRQRTRWSTGIVMQAWERHGWGEGWDWYWFWRDRKGVIGHPASLAAALMGGYALVGWMAGRESVVDHWLLPVTAVVGWVQVATRVVSTGRIYGWRFAALAPLRSMLGHLLNTLAVLRACGDFLGAKRRGAVVAWRKTEHDYPGKAALAAHRRKLGEILVSLGYLDVARLEKALASQPRGVPLGRYLVELGMVNEGQVYEALSVQSSVPFGQGVEQSPGLARSLPPGLIRRRRAVPLCVERGVMIVATPEIPDEEVSRELMAWVRLPVRFRLVTPGEFERLFEGSR